jgi:hypothetical protein
MKKSSRETEWKERPDRTVGVDLGDRFSRYCVLNSDGEVIEEGRVRTNEESLRRHTESVCAPCCGTRRISGAWLWRPTGAPGSSASLSRSPAGTQTFRVQSPKLRERLGTARAR